MDVEAATDEIPSKALSCSPLIEISNLLEEFDNFIMVWLQWKTGLKESRMSLSRKIFVPAFWKLLFRGYLEKGDMKI